MVDRRYCGSSGEVYCSQLLVSHEKWEEIFHTSHAKCDRTSKCQETSCKAAL